VRTECPPPRKHGSRPAGTRQHPSTSRHVVRDPPPCQPLQNLSFRKVPVTKVGRHLLLHDSGGDCLAEDLQCSAKAAADVQFPCPQHGCLYAVRPTIAPPGNPLRATKLSQCHWPRCRRSWASSLARCRSNLATSAIRGTHGSLPVLLVEISMATDPVRAGWVWRRSSPRPRTRVLGPSAARGVIPRFPQPHLADLVRRADPGQGLGLGRRWAQDWGTAGTNGEWKQKRRGLLQ
jgi:hypothetical protein